MSKLPENVFLFIVFKQFIEEYYFTLDPHVRKNFNNFLKLKGYLTFPDCFQAKGLQLSSYSMLLRMFFIKLRHFSKQTFVYEVNCRPVEFLMSPRTCMGCKNYSLIIVRVFLSNGLALKLSRRLSGLSVSFCSTCSV